MNTVADNVRAGHYATKLDYPAKPRKPVLPNKATAADARAFADLLDAWERDMATYNSARNAYNEDQNALYTQFRKDLEEENGMTGHPKANLLYSKAYDMGHSAGLSEIVLYYDDLLELVK